MLYFPALKNDLPFSMQSEFLELADNALFLQLLYISFNLSIVIYLSSLYPSRFKIKVRRYRSYHTNGSLCRVPRSAQRLIRGKGSF
jgi:hypothetical protein